VMTEELVVANYNMVLSQNRGLYGARHGHALATGVVRGTAGIVKDPRLNVLDKL
jgi:hypothetical protein